jgi:hypothetical protein
MSKEAEEFYYSNYRSKYSPLFDEANRKIQQFTFDEMMDCMQAFAEKHHIDKLKKMNPENLLGWAWDNYIKKYETTIDKDDVDDFRKAVHDGQRIIFTIEYLKSLKK